jgi:hypothetical protein
MPFTQSEPGQQSALVEHMPQDGTHWVGKHVRAPVGPGTHGLPTPPSGPQQSALVAHAPFAPTHVARLQRGMPRLSCLHVSAWQFPLQQSHDELHELVARRHTSPFGLQPVGFWQTPTPLTMLPHVEKPPCDCGPPPSPGNAAEPQHSLSLAHVSPTKWHPLAGWQMSTPVGAHGAHARLQHAPPHCGMPPSMVTMPPSAVVPAQSMPSARLQFAPPVGTGAHVPSACVPVMLQMPEQQLAPTLHESPTC